MFSLIPAFVFASTALAAVVPVQAPTHDKRDINTVSGKQYFTTNLGCYSDNWPTSRVLPGPSYSEPTYNTLFRCAEFCADRGFAFSGAEYSQECYCGNTLPSIKLDDAQCDYPCSAEPDENCGGSNALTIQQITYVQSLGCYADQVNYRSLNGASYSSPDMTIEKCAGLCSGFSNYGLEFGSECYCGNGLRLGSTDASQCNMACAGSANEICGGSNALSVYGKPIVAANAVTPLGCFTDYYPQSRVLDGANTASDGMTEAICASFCAERAYTLFGTEFGRECYCGNAVPSVSSSGCTQACAGDSSEICGGSNAISVYYYNANGAPAQISASSSAIASATATAAPSLASQVSSDAFMTTSQAFLSSVSAVASSQAVSSSISTAAPTTITTSAVVVPSSSAELVSSAPVATSVVASSSAAPVMLTVAPTSSLPDANASTSHVELSSSAAVHTSTSTAVPSSTIASVAGAVSA